MLSAKYFAQQSEERQLYLVQSTIEEYLYQKDWCEKHAYMDKRTWEYKAHKGYMDDNRQMLIEWGVIKEG